MAMISEIVTFKLRAGMTRAELVALYRRTAPVWRSNPDCIRKCYLFDADNHLGGGAYLWKNLAAAKRAHGEDWRRMINDLYGSEGQISISYFETPLVADNLVQRTIEDDAAAGKAA
jgi:hypothetical protein